MQKFLYTDGDKIGVFDGEQCRLLESEYIVRYRENAANRVKNGEWKYTGEGARDRKSTRLNSSHLPTSRMPSSA